MTRPRAGSLTIDRAVALQASADPSLHLSDVGLLLNVWLDARWRAKRVHIGGHVLELRAGQALVAVVRMAQRLHCAPNTVRAGLARLSKAGWLHTQSTPLGVICTCRADPRAGRGVRKYCAPHPAEFEHPPAQDLSTNSNTPRYYTPGNTPGPREAQRPVVAFGAAVIEEDLPPALHDVPRALVEAGRKVGVSRGFLAAMLADGHAEDCLLSWVLEIGRRGDEVRDPEAWARDRLRSGPCDSTHRLAKGLLQLAADRQARLPMGYVTAHGAEPIGQTIAKLEKGQRHA